MQVLTRPISHFRPEARSRRRLPDDKGPPKGSLPATANPERRCANLYDNAYRMDAPEEAWRREYTRRCKRREIVVRVSRAKAETSRRPKIEEAVKNVGGESVLRP